MFLTKNELKIIRLVNCPIKEVWKAWTKPELFKKWWGPKNFVSPFCKMDFRKGGKYLYCMHSPRGRDFWITGIFKEIVPMQHIVFTVSFADNKGKIVSATYYNLSIDFPMEMEVIVSFNEEKGKTFMILSQLGIPEGKMYNMTKKAWEESFDKLIENLE